MRKYFLAFLVTVLLIAFGGHNAECGTTYSFSALDGEWELSRGSGTLAGLYDNVNVTGTASAKSGKVDISNISDLGNGTATCFLSLKSDWNLRINASGGSYTDTFSFDLEEPQTITRYGQDTFVYGYDDQYSGVYESGYVTILLTSDSTAQVTQDGNISSSTTDIDYEFVFYLNKKGSSGGGGGGGGGGCNAGMGTLGALALALLLNAIIIRKKT